MNNIRYTVWYTPRSAVAYSDLIASLDLGISSVVLEEQFMIATSTEPDAAYLARMRLAIREFLEREGCKNVDVDEGTIIILSASPAERNLDKTHPTGDEG